MFIKDGVQCEKEVYDLLCMLELHEKITDSIYDKTSYHIGTTIDRTHVNIDGPSLWIATDISLSTDNSSHAKDRWGLRIELGDNGVWRKKWQLSTIDNFNDRQYNDNIVARTYKDIIKVMKEMKKNPDAKQIKELESKLAAEKDRHNQELTKIQEQIAALKK